MEFLHMPKELSGLSDQVLTLGSRRGRVPTQVQARRPGNEGGVGRAGPNQMEMWSSPRPFGEGVHSNLGVALECDIQFENRRTQIQIY